MSLPNPLHPQRYLHTIHAARECERLRHIYCDVFGGIVFSENYYGPEDRDAALLYVADHMIEVMSPRHTDDTRFMYARYLAKSGPGYHSISFRVADAEAAHRRCDELGILINTVGPGLIFLHPKSTGGLIMELTDHRMPNDPWDLPNWRRDWAAGRSHKPHALAHVICAPRVPGRAIRFLVEVLDGTEHEPVRIDWPEPAIATRVDVADVALLVLDPVSPATSALAEFANGPNGGVYALGWKVADPTATAAWMRDNHTCNLEVKALAPGAGYSHALVLDGARHWLIEDPV
ncbi:MAG: VOC family protein [Novosphingobium sp.]|nr:VOC family protein [Novosphingobium sp.]